MTVSRTENWRQNRKYLVDLLDEICLFKWSAILNNFLKNILKLFLCKNFDQTAVWYNVLVFLLQLSFSGQMVWLYSLSVSGHSHRFFQQILFFSLVQLLIQTVFQIFLRNFGLNKVPINIIQWVYIR